MVLTVTSPFSMREVDLGEGHLLYSAPPSGPGALLSWGTVLNQVGILAVLALVFLLAFRLRREPVHPQVGVGCFFPGQSGILESMREAACQDDRGHLRTLGTSSGLQCRPLMAGIFSLFLGAFQKDAEGLVDFLASDVLA